MHLDGLSLREWEGHFESFLWRTGVAGADPAHDLAHVRRVVANARGLARTEGADLAVVVPAAWLHDCVQVPKHSPERISASRLAADAAGTYLREAGFPSGPIPAIEHAIHAHSFSAAVAPRSIEAKVVQDADRLDALGAIGIARTLLLGGALGTRLYDPEEPFPTTREPDDRAHVIDHFYTKLLHLADRMQTRAGRHEAERRTDFMRRYLAQLERELGTARRPGLVTD